MKCLTIQGPWAQAIAYGLKAWELRTWATTYRGPIAIHAGKTFNESALSYFPEVTDLEKTTWRRLSGHIIAVVTCEQILGFRDLQVFNMHHKDHRCPSSFWKPGLRAWVFSKPSLVPPVFAKGKLGFWRHIGPLGLEVTA